MRRLLRLSLYGLLGLLLLLLAVLAWVLGSSSGSRWALAQVPGLTVEGAEGRLGGHWQAEQLHWRRGEYQLRISAPAFSWSPGCLWRLTLCIEQLQAAAVELIAPSGAEDGPRAELPSLGLPLRVQLAEARIGAFSLNGTEQLQELQLAAQWRGDGLQIQHLRLRRAGLALNLEGHLEPRGDWPLRARGDLQLPAPEGQPWSLALETTGSLRGALQLSADSRGYLNGRLSAEVQPLAAQLPARAELRADAFKASAALPDSLRLDALELAAEGDLEGGYRLTGSASLPGEGGALAVALNGRVDARGAEVAALSISAGTQQRLDLSGRMDWQDAFSLESRFSWLDFPWQRLYPPAQPLAVSLHRLEGELSYQAGQYLGHFAAELQGPAGPFSLRSPLSGDLQQLHLPALQVEAGQGRADGQLRLGFVEELEWSGSLQLSQLDPAYWLAELPGQLGGPLRVEGRYRQQHLSLQADADLAGRLRGQTAQLQFKLEGAGQRWSLSQLELRLGANRIEGSAELDEALSGQLQLSLARLDQLWTPLQGRLQGRLDLAGSLQAPAGQLRLQGSQLALADRRIGQLALDAELDSAQHGRLTLEAEAISLGDTPIGRLRIEGQGQAQAHALNLRLEGPRLDSRLALQGRWQQGAWRGELASGEVRSGGQHWRLRAPASLMRRADGRIEFGAHCWQAPPASLCAGQQRLLPEPSLRYRLSDFPLDSLAPWLPQDFAWDGRLDGELALDLAEEGPQGEIRLDAGSGTWRIRDGQHWLDFSYDALQLVSQLRPERIDSLVQLRGDNLGELELQTRIDPRPVDKPLSGQMRLRNLDLAALRPFLPRVEQLAGQLRGDARLSGTLLAPRVDGSLQLVDGQIGGRDLPIPIEDLQLQAQIAGETARLTGSWRSGEQGRGSLDGDLGWREGLSAALQLRGSRLPLSIEPYAELEVEPDLRLSLAEQRLQVSGRVAIPRGAIEIRELPPETVRVSEDARIVGREAAEQRPLKIGMDVEVEVGQERVRFRGFGLRADLAGRVQIGDDLDTRGELSFLNGRFRAYGQRLSLRRARLLFVGPIDQPYLDVEAIRQVDRVVAGLRLSGRVEQPKSEVFAEPPMSQEQALSYLVLGRPLGQSNGDSNMLAQAALAMGLAGSAPLAGSLAEGLGIEEFQLDSEGSGLTTSVVASGKLSERLSLRYGVGVFEPANTLALRYQLSKRIYLEAASGLASSLDLFYRREF